MAGVATPSNGSYLQHADPQHFPANATGAPPPNYQQPNPPTAQTTSPDPQPPKDEVGWYFVEQYYTTLNKTPERLHLFYNKKSSFVWGTEGESLPLAQGRNEIHEKIASHQFKDCKVRVSNVDSQGSANGGIVIQVLGEMSNDGNSNRKFSQTFFLAEQPNGYYVLNDIFRYLKDDDDIEGGDEYEYAEEAPEAEAEDIEQPVEETPEVEEPISQETATPEVETDPQAEEAQGPESTEPVAEEPINGTNGAPETEAAPEEKHEESQGTVEPEAKPEEVAPTPAPVEEKPSTPTPAVKEPERPAPAPAPAPSRPKTWANLVAASSAPAAPAATSVAAPAAPAAIPAAAPAAAPATPSTPTTPGGGAQWQTADNKRHSRAALAQTQTSAYIRNVTEAVSTQTLKDTLSKYGNLKHFEVIRTKNCAFADFETPAQFAAANAANPHVIAGSNVLVEERRPRGEVGGSYRGGPRGNMSGGRNDGRNSSQGGGRGGFQPRGDGQNRGRGGAGGRGGFSGGRGSFRTTTPTA